MAVRHEGIVAVINVLEVTDTMCTNGDHGDNEDIVCVDSIGMV